MNSYHQPYLAKGKEVIKRDSKRSVPVSEKVPVESLYRSWVAPAPWHHGRACLLILPCSQAHKYTRPDTD